VQKIPNYKRKLLNISDILKKVFTMMDKRIECTICAVEKKEKYFYKGRRQCIPCYKERNKSRKITHKQLEEHDAIVRDQIDELEKKLADMSIRQEDVKHMNVAMNYYQQITAKMENSLQDIQDKVDKICEDVLPKMDDLVEENKQLRDRINIMHYRMDTFDENIRRCVSVTEGLFDKDSHEIGERMRNQREMSLEVADAYYQYVMGYADKYDVERRFSARGYLRKKDGEE
jgi:predicted nuclease with TOPRIM domain